MVDMTARKSYNPHPARLSGSVYGRIVVEKKSLKKAARVLTQGIYMVYLEQMRGK